MYLAQGIYLIYPELSSSKGIEITPKTSGVVPVTVSGDSGVRIDGYFEPHFTLTKIDGNFVMVNGPVVFQSLSYESTSHVTSSQIDKTINITSIIDQVNSNDYSPEEKEKIKQILELIQKEVPTKPLPGVMDSIKARFKEWLPIASPFIQQGISLYLKAG
jgi:hypothetical protein